MSLLRKMLLSCANGLLINGVDTAVDCGYWAESCRLANTSVAVAVVEATEPNRPVSDVMPSGKVTHFATPIER